MSAGTRTAPVECQVGGGLDAPAWKKPLNYEYFCLCTFSRKAAPGLPQGLFKEAIDTSHQNWIFPSIPRVSGVELLAEQAQGRESSCSGEKGTFASFPGSKLARRQLYPPSPGLQRQRTERRCALPGKFPRSVPSLHGHCKVSSSPTDLSLAALKSKFSLAAAQSPGAGGLWWRDPTRQMPASVWEPGLQPRSVLTPGGRCFARCIFEELLTFPPCESLFQARYYSDSLINSLHSEGVRRLGCLYLLEGCWLLSGSRKDCKQWVLLWLYVHLWSCFICWDWLIFQKVKWSLPSVPLVRSGSELDTDAAELRRLKIRKKF